MENLLRFSLKHPLAVVIFTLLVCGYGAYSLTHLSIDAVPDITPNQVQINTTLQGYSPTQMEKRVTYPIESALTGIPGLKETRSITRNGFSQVTAVFDESVSLYFARQQINEHLSQLVKELPAGAEPQMGPISTGLGEIYMWTVDFIHPDGVGAALRDGRSGWQSDGSYLTPERQRLVSDLQKASYLRTVQDWIVRPQLKRVPGLAGVDSIGGFVRQYDVEPNLEAMIGLGLSLNDLKEVLLRNNVSIAPGHIERNGEAFLLKAEERIENPSEIENMIITMQNGVPVRVRDVAQVRMGREMRTGSATKDGREVVIGTALMLIGANSRTVAVAVDQRLQEINHTLPPDIQAVPVLNRTKLVDSTIQTVALSLSEGAVLVIAVLFLFLGQFRAALITALVIPFSMLMAAIGMIQTNISGNLMSLGAIDFGLLVDGAVIVTENCLRRLALKQRELGHSLGQQERLDEVLLASKEMIQPTVYGQAIIMIVYVPLLTLTGIEGRMFHPMAMTVIFALASAFLLSLMFVPAMIALFVRDCSGINCTFGLRQSPGVERSETTQYYNMGSFPIVQPRELSRSPNVQFIPEQSLSDRVPVKEAAIMAEAKKWYSQLLTKTLRIPARTISVAAALMLGFLLLSTQIGQEFVPTLDEQDIALQVKRIPSTSLTQSTQMQKEVEKALNKVPEVAYAYSKTGTAEFATDPMPPNISNTFVMLKPRPVWANPSLPKDQLIGKLREALKPLVGNSYEFTQPIEMRLNELISGVRSEVAAKISGDDFDKMHQVASKIADLLKTVPGANDISISQTRGLPVVDIKIDREAASRYGLNASDALDMVAIASGGGSAGQIFEGERRFNVVVRLPEQHREDLQALERLPIPLPRGKASTVAGLTFPHIPLGEIARIHVSEGLNEISREDGKRFVSVEANVRGNDLGSFVAEAKRRIKAEVQIPKGYWLYWGGQFENLVSARERLSIVLPICFVLILLLLFAALGSLVDALLVFSGVPMALTGGIVALWLRDMPFSISSAVGFITLSGIAVLNGLVMLTYIRQLLRKGLPLEQAVAEGAITRLRPVLMTALVTSLGFLPMALAIGTGAEIQKPLATVIIGGLFSATLLTLLVLPTLFVTCAKRRQAHCAH